MKKVLCGGCFNKIHPGHAYFLKQAKAFGDYLIVVLANDKNNKKKYAVPAKKRMTAIKKLKLADKIVVGSPDNFINVVKKHKPSIVAIGYDQSLPLYVRKYLKKNNINTVRIKKLGNYSSRKMQKS
jgi:cytidyltransferase-like protein